MSAALLALGGISALSAGTAHAAPTPGYGTVTDCTGNSAGSFGQVVATTGYAPNGVLRITFDCHDTAANGNGPYSIALPSQIAVGSNQTLYIDGQDTDTANTNHYDITIQVPTGLANGRAFYVHAGGDLFLSNLVLKGAAGAPPATSATAPLDQGGVEITGASQLFAFNVEFLNLQIASELHGGAVYVHPTGSDPGSPAATIGNSSFVGNYANFGGAIDAGPTVATYTSALTVVDSSFSGNVAQTAGGAINALTGSKVALSSDTIAGNRVNATGITILGSGIYSDTAAANFVIRNTIIANNTGATSAANNNCAYGVSSGITPIGANLEYNGGGTTNCGFSLTSNPAPLTFISPGPTPPSALGLVTPYWALGTGSPAVDASTDCTSDGTKPLTIDQIGDPRPSGVACDIGAYELPQVRLVILCGNLQSANANTAFGQPLIVQAVDVNGIVRNGVLITYTVGAGANGASGTLASPPGSATLTGTTGQLTLPADCPNGTTTVQGAVSFSLTANGTPSIPGSTYPVNVTAADAGGTPLTGVTTSFGETNLQLVADSCSLRIGFFSSLGSTNGSTSTQFSVATGRLLGGRRTLINYLALRGSAGQLVAVPVTSSVRCLLPYVFAGPPTTRLPLTVDFDATVASSGVPGIATASTIHVTIKQDLGASPPVQTVTITNLAGTTTYYAFSPSNYSVAPKSFQINAFQLT